MLTQFQQRMSDAVRDLRRGEVVSFGDVAAAAGRPTAARAAGRLLSQGCDDLPWWRVVYSDGRLPPCNPSLQAERLQEEGVQLQGFQVRRAALGRFAKPLRR
ncbi:cysteine methyltransferase [Roseiconus nitratireducens]|uniref:Cysteine methyltransferase n=1 Tax=Roseiconus nitratireducens TaxID=2605748 RepID=A0A5M6DHL2_9BACT|nr:MGMT family protein [Roseiconus nitratireducens]KAA5547037.1 cysteine methyltransferase [Roseiconus nitratireducens]